MRRTSFWKEKKKGLRSKGNRKTFRSLNLLVQRSGLLVGHGLQDTGTFSSADSVWGKKMAKTGGLLWRTGVG